MGDARKPVLTYTDPLPMRRPAHSHRFDVYSPKLGRALTLYSRNQLDQWVLLETAPEVQQFCERPAHVDSKLGKKRLVDFWACYREYEEFVVLIDAHPPANEYQAPDGVRLRCVTREELAQQRIYIANLRSMLPYVTTYRRWMNDEHVTRMVELCSQPTPLGMLERTLSAEDPLWARTLIFAAITKGRLRAESLTTRPWDPNTLVSRFDHGD